MGNVGCAVLELSLQGGSVAHILRYKYPEGLSEVVIATIMRKVLEALAYVHKQGDIHR
jgi:serine/threonine-protein kinase OSR1/STK39